MMPVVRLSDAAFADLKTISTWLEGNTPSETIDILVREKMEALGLERDSDSEPDLGEDQITLEFSKTPGLSFTRLVTAKVGRVQLKKPNWANLLVETIAFVKAKGLSGERLVSELQVPSRSRSFSEEGFKFYPQLGISVQGQSAQDAWKETERLAKKWKIPVEAEFQWRQNEKAQHPGRNGIMRVSA